MTSKFAITLDLLIEGPLSPPNELEEVTGRLRDLNCELLVKPGGHDSKGTSAGAARVRLLECPRPWYQWEEAIETSSLLRLAELIEFAIKAGFPFGIFEISPAARRADVARRLAYHVAPSDRILLFGAGQVGRHVASLAASLGTPPAGFLDNDPRLQGTLVGGYKVYAPNASETLHGPVVLCTGAHHALIRDQLAGIGPRPVIHLSEYMLLLGCPREPEKGYAEGLWNDRFRYLGLLGALADSGSRRVLAQVLSHRLTFDGRPLAEVASGDQWFIPEIFSPSADHVLVDGGAYDGDTAMEFLKRNGTAARALHLFEPDAALCKAIRSKLSSVDGVTVHEAGLADREGFGSFSSTGRMDGALSEGGDTTIRLAALDHEVTTPVTLIKLDVEGAELAALEGARRTIEEWKPALAVAVYHHHEHLWRVPAWIEQLCGGYRIRLRHHTELAYETVAYASV